MNTNKILALSIAISVAVSSFAHGKLFSFSYKTVFDQNAQDHVVSTANMTRYDEGLNWASFWAPIQFDQDAILVQRFDFTTRSKAIALKYCVTVGNHANQGYALVDASADGNTWVTLTELPVGTASLVSFNELLPPSLVGTKTLYLRVKLRTQGPFSWDPKFAQFGRAASPLNNPQENIFEINADLYDDAALGIASAVEISVTTPDPLATYLLQSSADLVDWLTEETIAPQSEPISRFRSTKNTSKKFWRIVMQ